MQPSPYSLYIQVAAAIGVCFQVIVPVFFLVCTNGLLLYYLKSRNKYFQIQKWNPSKNSFDSSESKNDKDHRCSRIWSRRYLTYEKKITVTVILIVSCFIITNLPSAVVFFWIYTIKSGNFYKKKMDYALVVFSILIIVIGKIANFFFLFYSSAQFRKKLKQILNPFKSMCKSKSQDAVPLGPQIHYTKFKKVDIQS